MLIISAGMHRSGSTWLFNVLINICYNKKVEVYSCFHNKYDPTNSSKVHIIKIHKFLPHFLEYNSDAIILTRRDLRDIAASAVRRKLIDNKTEDIIKYLQKIVKCEFEAWMPHVTLQIPYETMMRKKQNTIKEIATLIGCGSIDPLKVHLEVDALTKKTIAKNKFDLKTQLHPNHITDGRTSCYHHILSKETIATINYTFEKWLKKHNYINR